MEWSGWGAGGDRDGDWEWGRGNGGWWWVFQCGTWMAGVTSSLALLILIVCIMIGFANRVGIGMG